MRLYWSQISAAIKWKCSKKLLQQVNDFRYGLCTGLIGTNRYDRDIFAVKPIIVVSRIVWVFIMELAGEHIECSTRWVGVIFVFLGPVSRGCLAYLKAKRLAFGRNVDIEAYLFWQLMLKNFCGNQFDPRCGVAEIGCYENPMAGILSMQLSITAPIVPEYITELPELDPWLMPETIMSGRFGTMACMASFTQSTGVPLTA